MCYQEWVVVVAVGHEAAIVGGSACRKLIKKSIIGFWFVIEFTCDLIWSDPLHLLTQRGPLNTNKCSAAAPGFQMNSYWRPSEAPPVPDVASANANTEWIHNTILGDIKSALDPTRDHKYYPLFRLASLEETDGVTALPSIWFQNYIPLMAEPKAWPKISQVGLSRKNYP
ncbi:hypothetical protein FB451DRAFT_1164593 [Mycena latifolia]|nr:hypothetical protein FB451DRAFT_1164593 [Mycena latifolia]